MYVVHRLPNWQGSQSMSERWRKWIVGEAAEKAIATMHSG